MPVRINTNVSSLVSQTYLDRTQHTISKSFQRLSSGFRINTSADDAAGLAVSENLRAQIRSYMVAERNTNNAISMIQTAEGGMGHISSILIRMRELAVQSANGDMTETDRAYLDTEYQLLKEEITRLAETTEFNHRDLLAGTYNNIDFQVGIYTSSYDVITVRFGGVSLVNLGLSASTIGGSVPTYSTDAIDEIDAAFSIIATRRADFGAMQNRLEVTQANTQTIRTNISAANSRIRDVDVAEETSQLARAQVLLQAGTAMLAQANQLPQFALMLLQ